MTASRIDHTAIAVRDLDAAIERYRELLGAAPAGRTLVPDQRVEVCFLPFGDTQLELICPTDSDSGVARFLDRRGEGLHHIALAVDDIRAELQELAARGVELIDREPRSGAHGLVAFIHPRAGRGVLIELIQRA
ncbi:MAG TPA: methylmalonyl-CoA epimerase [Chloroflexota bacterium]|nr:methylmalonyl-CoA epimerase [Chloroflexota bacterium]